MTGPRQRHIHDAPLFGVLEGLFLWRDQRQEGVGRSRTEDRRGFCGSSTASAVPSKAQMAFWRRWSPRGSCGNALWRSR
jgi:hypothetical protein